MRTAVENNIQSTNDYLYYVITDNDKNVRGHVIGVQHWVEPKDQDFNLHILKAIDDSARVILEIPPDAEAPLLPTKANSKNYKIIISETLSKVKSKSNLEGPLDTNFLEAEIEKILKDIEDKGLKARDKGQQGDEKIKNKGYEAIKIVLADLPSREEKLKFLKIIQGKIFDFNLVSLERKIHKKVMNPNKKIEPLEESNLNEKLLEAKIKISLRNIKEKLPETDYQKVVEQLNLIQDGEEKLEFLQQQKNQLGIKNKDSPISYEEEQSLKEELYRAWVDGNVEKLRDLLKTAFEVFKEEPEMNAVHQPRVKQMAERIIKVVCEAKEEEAAFIMGCAHLIYSNLETNRTNIIDYLNDYFQRELKGWSIRQITKNDIINSK